MREDKTTDMDLYSDYSWIEDGDILFQEGVYFNSAYYGWQTQNGVAFAGYIEGYRIAANKLIDEAIEAAKQYRIEVCDTLVFPILFLYRQYIELALKDMFITCSFHSNDEIVNFINKSNHDLMRAWEMIKPIMKNCATGEEDDKSIEIAESYIRQFHSFSKTSFEFRYPIDKKGDIIHSEPYRLDLLNLKDKMERLSHFFDGVSSQMLVYRDYEEDLIFKDM